MQTEGELSYDKQYVLYRGILVKDSKSHQHIDLSKFDFKWIISDPGILSGKPVVRGTRISVAQVLRCLSHGMNVDDIKDMYGDFPEQAIPEALALASYLAEEALCG